MFALEKTSEEFHLDFLCETIGCDAVVASLLSLTLAHALGGALVLADRACVCLIAKHIFLWCTGVTGTWRDEEWLCLWCRGEENELLCCL